MSNTNSNNSNVIETGKRGRPSFVVNIPATPKFTLNDLRDANPHITCRLTLYSKRNFLVKTKQIKLTNETIHTGGVGKPLAVYVKTDYLARSKAAKKAAKTRKTAAQTSPEPVADVSVTPTDVPSTDNAPDTVSTDTATPEPVQAVTPEVATV